MMFLIPALIVALPVETPPVDYALELEVASGPVASYNWTPEPLEQARTAGNIYTGNDTGNDTGSGAE